MEFDAVVVRSYLTEIEAELALATLRAHGIPGLVQRNDAAGLFRNLQGVKIVVRSDDLELARVLLDSAADPAEDGDSAG
ncbi:MAG: hypothetical protein ABR543_15455 [Gemmatimonadaceae bacterium]